MPSPAVDTFAAVVTTGRYEVKYSWVPGEPSRYNINVPQQTQALKCPATVRNKLQPGQPRPMSAWNKQWCRGQIPVSSWAVELKDGDYTTTWTFSGTPVYSALPSITTNSGMYWDQVVRTFPFTSSLEFRCEQAARTNVLNKVGQKKWDLGVTALELKQTAGLVSELAVSMTRQVEDLINSRKSARQRVDNFFRDVRRQGSFDKAAANVGMTDIGLLQSLKDRWMQYQFGIRPAIADIDNATSYLADLLNRSEVGMLVKAKAGHELTDDYNGANGAVSSIVTCRPRITEVCQVHYSVLYEIPTGGVSELNLLGLDNPWNVLWEKTQLSWMADYVVGVGDWLQSFTATNGMTFREGCRSTLRRVSANRFVVSPASKAYKITKSPVVNGAWAERGDFRREMLDSRLVPAVVPQIKSTLGLTQLGNSLFALSNVLGGGRIYR